MAHAARRLGAVPLAHLGLDAVTERRLAGSGYTTVGDLLVAGPSVLQVRRVGRRSLKLIDSALRPLLEQSGPPAEAGGRAGASPDLVAASLAFVRDLPAYERMPWYEAPLADRAAAALVFPDHDARQLALSDDCRSRLMDSPLCLTARLLRATGPDMEALLQVRPQTALSDPYAFGREVHQALQAAAADRLACLELHEPIGVLCRQLEERGDLADLAVQLLPLPAPLCYSLAHDGLSTLGLVLGEGPAGLTDRLGYQQDDLRGLRHGLELTLALPESARGVDWARLWQEAGLRLVPQEWTGPGSLPLGRAVQMAMRDVVLSWMEPVDWDVLRQRYGLLGSPMRRLQWLGDEMGVSRQRVQQREARAVRRIGELSASRPLPRDWPRDARMHPHIAAVFEDLLGVLARVNVEYMHHERLHRLTDPILDQDQPALDPLVRLLADAMGLRRIGVALDDPARVWLPDSIEASQARLLERTIHRVHTLLTERTQRAFTEVALTDALNAEDPGAERLRVSEVAEAVRLCSTVEHTRFGEIRGRTGWLVRREHVVERLLEERGEPMHLTDIVQELNAAYVAVGRRPISLVTAGNYLSASENALPIGKSGYWALRSWEHVETATILELMERCLVEHGQPMTADQIYAYVSARRPLRQASVLSYLASDPRFAKIDRTRFALATWPEAEPIRRWNRRAVAELARDTFAARGTDQLPYRELADALELASGLRRPTVRGLLATNPVITTHRVKGGQLMAVFDKDYEAALARGRNLGLRPGKVLAEITRLVHRTLEAQPGHTMLLTELRTVVLDQVTTTKGTFYSYVDSMPGVEKVRVAGSRRMMIRLVDGDDTTPSA